MSRESEFYKCWFSWERSDTGKKMTEAIAHYLAKYIMSLNTENQRGKFYWRHQVPLQNCFSQSAIEKMHNICWKTVKAFYQSAFSLGICISHHTGISRSFSKLWYQSNVKNWPMWTICDYFSVAGIHPLSQKVEEMQKKLFANSQIKQEKQSGWVCCLAEWGLYGQMQCLC